jgi:DNA-binding response OmpR family regulator
MKRKAIIIEDDPGILDVLQMLFTRAGYEVAPYVDGNFLFRGGFAVPDIFVVDKQLSGVDGLDICRYLKNQADTREVPVIILSATPHLHMLVEKAGADAFLEKPFSNRYLLQIAEQLLAR